MCGRPVYRTRINGCLCACVCTFRLGGHSRCCGALSLAVAIVGNDPEAVFGVWHQVLDGDLHLSGTAGIHHSLSDVDTQVGRDFQLKKVIVHILV